MIDGKRRISLKNSFTHAMVVAATGGGKTTTYILPNILSLAKNGHSIAVTDPSGELFAKTSDFMKSKGYEVKVINPNDLENSSYFNPLSRAENYSDIAKVSKILVEAAFSSKGGNDAFWNNGAMQIIEISIKLLHLKSKKYCNLINLNSIIQQIGGSEKQRKKIDRMMSDTLDNATFESYLSFVSQDPKVFQSMLSTAKTALSWVSDPALGKLTSVDTLEFKLREKPTILYVIVPEAELSFYAPLLNLLYSQLFRYAMQPKEADKSYLPIFFLLDEFANIGRLPNFETIISTIRKRDCSISIVLQDLAQLEQVYGRQNATTISTNCVSQLYIGGGLSYETCKKLEGVLGQATIEVTEKGYSSKGNDHYIPERERYMGRSLMTADEIRTLPSHKGLFLFGNMHPTVVRLIPYYKQYRWRKIE